VEVNSDKRKIFARPSRSCVVGVIARDYGARTFLWLLPYYNWLW